MDQPLSDRIDYEHDLNESQLKAVQFGQGPLLVIAGAGSGKTRTIVYRVAWLVEQGIDPESILLLTFTRKSSQEMLSRASMLLDGRVSRVAGGTFHSTGNLLLRRFGRRIGIDPSFSIMDQGDSIEAIDHCKKTLSPAPEDMKGFPKARTISAIISHAVGRASTIDASVEHRFPHLESYAPDVERVFRMYEDHKRANNLMDYDDLLVHAIRLLEEDPQAAAEISQTWTYILVDEYQDTNRLQARMLRLIASHHDNVMAVGDDSQSIYSFRGADFRNIMTFADIFPGAVVIKLEENYRSTAPILNVTNAIISRAAQGYPKRLFTKQLEGPLPMKVRPSSERDQSRFVVQCVRELIGYGMTLGEIAVLFRAGFHSFDLEGELTRSGIPFVKYGGFKFLESLHIKDVLAHLKVVNNPKDRLSWVRVLRILPGVGVKTALKLADVVSTKGVPRDAGEVVTKSRKYFSHLKELFDLINEVVGMATPISEKVDRINRYYFPFLKDNYDNYPKRMRDLEHLADLTVSYKSLNRFLNDMALEPPDEEGTGAAGDSPTLVLSTIHSAKGLEWHTVVLIWAAEGRIPSPMASDSPDELEEERRLLYVAATRAKHNLVVVAPQVFMDRNRGMTPVRLSRFFEEIPGEYFRTYSIG